MVPGCGKQTCAYHALSCPLDPKDCRIAELERQLEEAGRPCHRSHPHEDDPGCPFNHEVHVSMLRSNAVLRSERDAALAQVGMLREALEDLNGWVTNWSPHRFEEEIEYDDTKQRVTEALSNTSATAQQVKALEVRLAEGGKALIWCYEKLDAGTRIFANQATHDAFYAAVASEEARKKGAEHGE